MSLPGEAAVILVLDVLVLLGWILVFVRSGSSRTKVGLAASATGVWFLGIGLSAHRLFDAAMVVEFRGWEEPERLAQEFGNALTTAAWSTIAAIWLVIFAIIAFAIPAGKKREVQS